MSRILVSSEVREAVAGNRPVVALESTVLTHGLPRPDNLALARELEALARDQGAVPATIAVVDGRPTVGLSADQLERIATDTTADKLSTRDLPVAAARGRTGGTTVAATIHLAHAAGIAVFATGGIGGVHRGEPLDVSADLTQLARTRIVVVCAGAKSILDLPATREALESAGVLVIGWRTDRFPAFYMETSDLPVDVRVDEPREVAEIWRSHGELGLGSAMLVCAPVPPPDAVPAAELEEALSTALRDAAREAVRGKEITPHLLRALSAATEGRSLRANLALLRNNVRIASAVAAAISLRG